MIVRRECGGAWRLAGLLLMGVASLVAAPAHALPIPGPSQNDNPWGIGCVRFSPDFGDGRGCAQYVVTSECAVPITLRDWPLLECDESMLCDVVLNEGESALARAPQGDEESWVIEVDGTLMTGLVPAPCGSIEPPPVDPGVDSGGCAVGAVGSTSDRAPHSSSAGAAALSGFGLLGLALLRRRP